MRRWIPFWFVAALALGAALPLGCGEPEKCKGADCDGGQAGSGGSEPECQTNLDCEPGLACIEGECSPCGSDGHCLRVERCDPASLRCVYREGWGNECSAHEQCPLGRYCVQGLCIAVNLATPCGSMGQCPEGMRCNTRVGNPPVCEEDVGCGDDLDCRDNEVCNQRTGQCEIACTPENQAEVCRAREICVDGQCVECETDEDCSLGLVCDGGFCVGEGTCFTDRDCPVGQVCNRRIHICTERPPPCTSDNECLPDERCDVASGQCRLRACQPDLDAPNGSQEEAVLIGTGERRNLVVCENEEKWYRFELSEGDLISIIINTDVLSMTGFEAQFRTADGLVLASSVHEIKMTIAETGDYFLRIRTRNERVYYRLDVLIASGRPCRNDTFEPNNEAQMAKRLDAQVQPGLVICPGDVDWFEIEVPVGQGLSATLLQEELGNLELELYDGDGTTLLDRDDSTRMEKQVKATQLNRGRAFLRVRASDSRTENGYGLQIGRP